MIKTENEEKKLINNENWLVGTYIITDCIIDIR